jgi:transcriptional regulator with XRE-family HTH domain
VPPGFRFGGWGATRGGGLGGPGGTFSRRFGLQVSFVGARLVPWRLAVRFFAVAQRVVRFFDGVRARATIGSSDGRGGMPNRPVLARTKDRAMRGRANAAPAPVHLYAITNVCYNGRRMAATTDQLPIGPRVRSLREGMGLSLRDLAERSGVSAPMLSQVERGETSPTLSVAARIAAGLDLSLSQLLRLDEGGAVTVVRPADRRGGGEGGHAYEILTPPLPGQRAEVSRHVLAPGASTGGPGDPPMHEPGSRETALVERGALVLVCDGERHELQAGDCVTFDADLAHHFENPGDEEAALLAVVSAGLRRS